MKLVIVFKTEKPLSEPIVIADECGDSLWDIVLDQQRTTQFILQAKE